MKEPDLEAIHQPVLLEETLSYLAPKEGELIVDATLGIGGHTEAILSSTSTGRVLGLDQDRDALALAAKRLEVFGERLITRRGNFSQVSELVADAGLGRPNGILADLGVSSLQFDSETRGFSFRFDAPLDMRMDAEADIPTAAEILENLEQDEIANIIYEFGEERASRKIARWIVEKREAGQPIRTTRDLAELVRRAVPKGKDRIDPATRTFQALRIAVNGELDVLKTFIENSIESLAPEGVLAIITFHSLEDRIVKQAFQRLSGKCQCPPRIPQCMCGAEKKVEILTKKPVVPSEAEQKRNPRSRSSKLRACRRMAN